MALYRDVLVVQTRAGSELINAELHTSIVQFAERTTPEQTIRRIDALAACREAIEMNVAPLLALEAMTIALFEG
jgi:DNA polymerase-3 subunit delta'